MTPKKATPRRMMPPHPSRIHFRAPPLFFWGALPVGWFMIVLPPTGRIRVESDDRHPTRNSVALPLKKERRIPDPHATPEPGSYDGKSRPAEDGPPAMASNPDRYTRARR